MKYWFTVMFEADTREEAEGHLESLEMALGDAVEHMQDPPVRKYDTSKLMSEEDVNAPS